MNGPIIPRNSRAKQVGRSFLLALFHSPGLEIPWTEIQRKFIAAELSCSFSTLNAVAIDLVNEGILERPLKGLYRTPAALSAPLMVAEETSPSNGSDESIGSAPAPVVALPDVNTQLATIESRMAFLLSSMSLMAQEVRSIQTLLVDRLPERAAGL